MLSYTREPIYSSAFLQLGVGGEILCSPTTSFQITITRTNLHVHEISLAESFQIKVAGRSPLFSSDQWGGSSLLSMRLVESKLPVARPTLSVVVELS